VAGRLELRAREVERQIEELRQLKRELGQLRRRARTLVADAPPPDGYCHILERKK
jgi:hypothetical protein